MCNTIEFCFLNSYKGNQETKLRFFFRNNVQSYEHYFKSAPGTTITAQLKSLVFLKSKITDAK